MEENIFAEIGIGIAKLVSDASPATLTIHLQKEETTFCKKGYRLAFNKSGEEISAKADCLLDAINSLIEKAEGENG